MAYKYNYGKYDTRTLVKIWCFNGNVKLTDKIEKILESRGIDLSAKNVQKILVEEQKGSICI